MKIRSAHLSLRNFYARQDIQRVGRESTGTLTNVPLPGSKYVRVVLTMTIDYDDIESKGGQRKYEKQMDDIIKHVGEVDVIITKPKCGVK